LIIHLLKKRNIISTYGFLIFQIEKIIKLVMCEDDDGVFEKKKIKRGWWANIWEWDLFPWSYNFRKYLISLNLKLWHFVMSPEIIFKIWIYCETFTKVNDEWNIVRIWREKKKTFHKNKFLQKPECRPEILKKIHSPRKLDFIFMK